MARNIEENKKEEPKQQNKQPSLFEIQKRLQEIQKEHWLDRVTYGSYRR
jgi:hypothetical protein